MDTFPAPRRAVVAALVLASLSLAAAGGTAVARPPPHAVCGVCSDALPEAAERAGLDVGAAESSLAIRVDEAGTGHWTARVRLTGSDVDAVRANATLRDRLVERTRDRAYVAVPEPRSLTTATNGSTLVVSYAVPGMAHRSAGGVHVVDFFYWRGGEARWFSLAADRLTVRGPEGTVVTHAPPGARSTGEAVVWTAGDGRSDPLGARTHVAFAPDDGPVASAATAFGLGVDVAGVKAADLPMAVQPVLALLGLTAALLATSRRLAALSRRRLLWLTFAPVAAVGLVAAAAETLVGTAGPVAAQAGDFAFYLVYSVVATGAVLVPVTVAPLVVGQALLVDWLSEEGVEPGAVVRGAAAVLALQWLALPFAAAGVGGLDSLYGFVGLVLPGLYFLPLGLARRLGHRSWVAFAAGVALAPVPVVLGVAPHTGFFVRPVLGQYLPWALVLVPVGAVAYQYGWTAASPADRAGGTPGPGQSLPDD